MQQYSDGLEAFFGRSRLGIEKVLSCFDWGVETALCAIIKIEVHRRSDLL